MPIGGKGVTEPPRPFLVLMIIMGIVFLWGGLRRWRFFLESGRLPGIMTRLFVLSTEERNDYVAAFYIIGGLILIGTGLAIFVFFGETCGVRLEFRTFWPQNSSKKS